MKASILIPAFNAAALIEATLESCVQQGEAFIHEIIVIDDQSTDGTVDIVKAFANQHPTIGISVETNPQKGACSARNHAFRQSTGEAIQWLDADDLLGAGKLEAQLKLLKNDPNHLIATKWRRFTGTLEQLFPEESGAWSAVPYESSPLEWLSSERMMIPAGWLGARDVFQQTGAWDESLLINQDGEYFTRAIAAAEGVIFEPETRVYYRSGIQGSVSHFSPSKAPSLYQSIESFEKVALALGDPDKVGRIIANKYQGFLYRVYPLVPELRQKARNKIQQYGPSDRANDIAESPIARGICALFGWKFLVQLRLLRSKLSS